MTSEDRLVWLASYPRSGNTFLRTILWHCFDLRSASLYPRDLGDNPKLQEYVGHLEQGADGTIEFPAGNLPLVKTHDPPADDSPAIYVIRDGRAATVSLWRFHRGKLPLQTIIEEGDRFGTWGAHVEAWHPWARPRTLLLRYEEMRSDLPGTLSRLSQFLGRDPTGTTVPDRETIAHSDGKWVRRRSDWRTELYGELLTRFNEINGAVLERAGYSL